MTAPHRAGTRATDELFGTVREAVLTHPRRPLYVAGVPRSLIRELDRVALANDRSRTAEIRRALAVHVERESNSESSGTVT